MVRSKTVAILHTSLVFIQVEPVFKELFASRLPDVRIVDFVDSDVLASVARVGRITAPAVRRMCHLAQAADEAGVDAIFSVCSSLGPSMDVARQLVNTPIIKVDDAMTLRAAKQGGTVGVLATVPTTLKPSSDLLREKAALSGREIIIRESLCAGAFEALMGGDRDKHDEMVVAEGKRLAAEVDRIVLAQASMARLEPLLAAEVECEVLTSPRLGVDSLADSLDRPTQATGDRSDSNSRQPTAV